MTQESDGAPLLFRRLVPENVPLVVGIAGGETRDSHPFRPSPWGRARALQA